jgi:hypothetical protein
MYPGRDRLILLGHTLADVRIQLPPGLVRSERQPSDPPFTRRAIISSG